MKCKNCSAEIAPQWTHAINSNVCPSCGDEIMSKDELGVLAEVRDAVSQMNTNPEGLAGWLLSHYKLTKIGDAEPTQFHSVSTSTVKESTSQQTQTAEKSQLLKQFLERTGVKVPDPTALKKKVGSVEITDDEDDFIEDEEYEDEEVLVPGIMQNLSSAIDPREAIIQKQRAARKAMGGGGFGRA